jgi:hypothetical protein
MPISDAYFIVNMKYDGQYKDFYKSTYFNGHKVRPWPSLNGPGSGPGRG